MGLLSPIIERITTPVTALAVERAQQAEAQIEVLRESLVDLELAMEDSGWTRLIGNAGHEFSRDGLLRAAQAARVMAVAHPLVKRGLGIRQAYVWGQGVTIAARSTGDDDGEQDVNTLVQTFLDDTSNRAAFTGDQAREELERSLGTDGNVFLALATNPRTGRVQVRSIRFDEIVDIIANPDDADDPWYYKRQWVEDRLDLTAGTSSSVTRTAYYPATTYRPLYRPSTIGGDEVRWDAPVYHVSVNRLDGWRFGVGDAYAALTWARAYRDFLADWAVLVKSLSQFAWRATSGKPGKAQRMRQALARRPQATGPDGNPNNVGATAVLDGEATLEAIPKTGATIDSESGRPLAAMIAAALDVPVTTLLADPGQTGARAVAETLNLPTRLAMQQRRGLWGEAHRAVVAYVIREAVRAPQGGLAGTIIRLDDTHEEAILAGDTDQTIEIQWPSLEDEVPLEKLVEAIVKANSTELLPPVEVVKLLLAALNVPDPDEILAGMVDDAGEFIPPMASAGSAAVAAFRRGEDPAGIV